MNCKLEIELSEEEKEALDRYARSNNESMEVSIKRLAFEKMFDEYDLGIIKEFEKQLEKGEVTFKTYEEFQKELDLDDQH